MSVLKIEYDAAQALLDLQGTMKHDVGGPYLWPPCNDRQVVDMRAKMLWNRFVSPNVQAIQSSQTTKIQSTSDIELTKNLKPIDVYTHNKPRMVSKIDKPKLNRHLDSTVSKNIGIPIHSSHNLPFLEPSNRIIVNNTITREVATQTEEHYYHPNIEIMEDTIKELYDRIQSLENQLKKPDDITEQFSDFVSSDHASDDEDQSYVTSYDNEANTSHNENSFNETKFGEYRNYSIKMCYEGPEEKRIGNTHTKSEILHNKVITNRNAHAKSDLVPIGDGNASVPSRLLKNINWNSYTSATRKLLTAVFSRRILATHSLTGKPSPAFPNKPAKKKLDAALVNDIVQTVVERCAVPENIVRTSITTKCADESKMFKTRKSNCKNRKSKRNSENIPPTTSESGSEDF